MFEYATRDAPLRDELFFERLDVFMDKCLADIRAFAERESRPYEETRRYVAEWHAAYLFHPNAPTTSPPAPSANSHTDVRAVQVFNAQCHASRALESLCETSGIHSFLLSVDPFHESDEGFLGGSLLGREFWRGLRGGGAHGAKGFKQYCQKALQKTSSSSPSLGKIYGPSPLSTTNQTKHQGAAQWTKLELYDAVRNALRGVRNAEMKWTNPERLDIYGVRLAGWPEGIPPQNPSTLKVSQNRVLLDALRKGTMRFERADGASVPSGGSTTGEGGALVENEEDFSWAYDADGGYPASEIPFLDATPGAHSPGPGPDELRGKKRVREDGSRDEVDFYPMTENIT